MTHIEGSNSKIRELARYEVRPEALERCLAAIHEFVAYVRANEPGALRYEVWQQANHPTRFVHIFVWKDAESNRIHGESAAVKEFASILYPNCLAPVEFLEYTQVDANAAFKPIERFDRRRERGPRRLRRDDGRPRHRGPDPTRLHADLVG